MNILIVDDSRAMRSIVMRSLRQAGFSGHQISEAGDGKAALDLIESGNPDLVLSDWNMPEMPGIDLLRNVRQKGFNVPFVFVTSECTPDFRELAIHEGAADIISKPFTPDTLRTVLGGLIR